MKARKGKTHGPVDWDLLKRQLSAVEASIERRFAPPPEIRREILRARARVLAAPPTQENAPDQEIELLEFRMAHEHYALETCWVEEVHALGELTPLPCTPDFVRGIVNIRGRITSVIDLKRFFDLPDRGLAAMDKAIILSDGRMRFGILADDVVGVHRLLAEHIQPPLPTLTGIRAAYLKGATAQRLAVLDAGRLLADKAIVVDQETGTHTEA